MPPRIPMPGQRPKRVEPPRRPTIPVPLERQIDFCRVFVDGKRQPGNVRMAHALEVVERYENAFVWLSLKEPTNEQMEKIAEIFDVEDLVVDDVVDAHQRPKIERYDDMLFSVFKTMHYVAHASPTTANAICVALEKAGYKMEETEMPVGASDDEDNDSGSTTVESDSDS